MSRVLQGLTISAVGMAVVLAALVALWGLVVALRLLIRPGPPEPAPEPAPGPRPAAPPPSAGPDPVVIAAAAAAAVLALGRGRAARVLDISPAGSDHAGKDRP